MNKQNLEKRLKKELEILNDIIDRKIIKGLSYSKEARRHKVISESLMNLRKSRLIRSGWFGKSLHFASTFIF